MARTRINISLDPDTVADLKALAEARRSNVSAVIEQLVLAEKRASKLEAIPRAPTFRVRAGGSLLDAQVQLYAVYDDLELPVRADGVAPPVIAQPPDAGTHRARCIRVDVAAQQDAAARLTSLGLRADPTGQWFVASGDTAIAFWYVGLPNLPKEWDLFVPEDLVDAKAPAASAPRLYPQHEPGVFAAYDPKEVRALLDAQARAEKVRKRPKK